MIEVAPQLYVGDQNDYVRLSKSIGLRFAKEWAVVHACKEPHHREALGYTGRAAPKEHPEYLFARRDNRLMLNLVDVDGPAYVAKEIIDAALAFIAAHLAQNKKVLVHCNQGKSRSPIIAVLYLAPTLSTDSMIAEAQFTHTYPHYSPARGMRDFALANWDHYARQHFALDTRITV